MSHPRFLIAEDDPDLRPILTHVLADAFPLANVAAFPNGAEALAEFDRSGADLVVSNHSMPVMDGPTFVRALRQRSATLPIIMVSGTPEARGHGAAAGITAFLDKDRITPHLVGLVRGLLEVPVKDLAHAHPPRSPAVAVLR